MVMMAMRTLGHTADTVAKQPGIVKRKYRRAADLNKIES
jgi:hypothetical protein